MLPVYNPSLEAVHHRHAGSGLAHIVRSIPGVVPTRHAGKVRRAADFVLHILGFSLLLVSVWGLLSMTHRMQENGDISLPGLSTRNRRLMDERTRLLPAAPLRNLVLVAGHAVYVATDFSQAANESVWFLEEYQKVPGEAQSFLDHIRVGINQAAQDPAALLMFSGGQTRLAAGPRSEGLSYWVVAEAAGWFGHPEVRNRTFTEEHARDSFENLLFGLCRFFELTGHYPDMVTVVSYTLKKDRFFMLHRQALHFPADRFQFYGTEVPKEAKGALEGEARTVEAFKEDPYGCTGHLLQKRLRRDPFAVGPIHPSRCPDLRGLLRHCSPVLYEGRLPWDHDRRKPDESQELVKYSLGII